MKTWSFHNETKNQFGQVIKICSHTPQQNGIAKRKNRHLVEITCTLLLGVNLQVHN